MMIMAKEHSGIFKIFERIYLTKNGRFWEISEFQHDGSRFYKYLMSFQAGFGNC